MKDVLTFHYLPILWYRYPIPNEIREFWYNERPEILDYMQKAYKDLDIQFLPDSVVQQLNQQKLSGNVAEIQNSVSHSSFHEVMPTELLSNNSQIPSEHLSSYFHSISEHFENLHILF